MSLLSTSEWTNTRLVEECLRGSEQAWNALLDRYKNLIYSIPVRYGAPPQDAADIFQAVCLDLFNELPRLRDANALQGWLIRVATHKCYHWKKQPNRPRRRMGGRRYRGPGLRSAPAGRRDGGIGAGTGGA